MLNEDLGLVGCAHPSWLDNRCASCAAKQRIRVQFESGQARIRELEAELAARTPFDNPETPTNRLLRARAEKAEAELEVFREGRYGFQRLVGEREAWRKAATREKARAEKAEARVADLEKVLNHANAFCDCGLGLEHGDWLEYIYPNGAVNFDEIGDRLAVARESKGED